MTGFFQEVLDRVQIDEVRDGAEDAIAAELERGHPLMARARLRDEGRAARRGAAILASTDVRSRS